MKNFIRRFLSKITPPVEIYHVNVYFEDNLEQQNVEIDCKSNETLLQSFIRNNIDITYYCGGTCSCGTCRIEIISGELNKVSARESLVLGNDSLKKGDRLACQAYISSSAKIKIPKFF